MKDIYHSAMVIYSQNPNESTCPVEDDALLSVYLHQVQ